MGEFYWPVGLWSADRERLETVDALVDTGSSYSVFPKTMLERLGIIPEEREEFELADGSSVERDLGHAWLRLDGRERIRTVLFGNDDAESLIGADTLQGFLMLVDSDAHRLVRRPGRY